MASLLLCRSALRRSAVPVSLSLTTGLYMASRQQPLSLDSYATPASTRSLSNEPRRKDGLNSEIIKQLSGGSLSGFAAGLLISVFSKTLVLLAGIGIVLIQVASRYGINVVERLGLKKYMQSSRILAALNKNPAFKLSFGLTFALSAFMSF